MAKVVIVSGIPVINNPRVVKEADALAEIGIDVEVLGIVYDAESKLLIERLLSGRNWRHTPVADYAAQSFASRLDTLFLKIRWRLARLFKIRLNIDLPDQLGPVVRRLYRVARARQADLYILHLEQALWAGHCLIRSGFKVSADFEDWYSEDGLAEDRDRRPVALQKSCEAELLKNSAYVVTTSHALAGALAQAYQADEPYVVYNSFPLAERAGIDGKQIDRIDPSIPSITWFSQTVGPGRGLESLFAAFAKLKHPCELHIRGHPRPGFEETLLKDLSSEVRARILFHPQVPQDELLSRLAEHDIGYCGELADCASRDLTITNKMFEYMRAGLAIIASDTAGQVEVAGKAPEAVHLVEQGNAESIRQQLDTLLSDPERLARSKAASTKALERHFDWDTSKRTLQMLAGQALGLPIAKDKMAQSD